MNALRALAGGALWSYPSEFRRSYGEDILRDIEAEPERFVHIALVTQTQRFAATLLGALAIVSLLLTLSGYGQRRSIPASR